MIVWEGFVPPQLFCGAPINLDSILDSLSNLVFGCRFPKPGINSLACPIDLADGYFGQLWLVTCGRLAIGPFGEASKATGRLPIGRRLQICPTRKRKCPN